MNTAQLLTELADSGKLDWTDARLVRRAAKELTQREDTVLQCQSCGGISLGPL